MEVKFNNVSYVSNKKQIIDNVNIELKEGKINGFIGPNGSGKTTMIQMINGLIYPTKGNIIMENVNVTSKKNDNNIKGLYLNIGTISQHIEEHFFCESVEKELTLCLEIYNYKKEKIDKHIKDAIKMVGLSEKYLSRDPLELSSSEIRKVLLAKGLAINPKILILDEPTIGLDAEDKKSLIKLLKTIKRRYNKTIIIISQDIEFIHQLVDYIFVLKDGRILIEGDKYEVFKQYELLEKNGILVPKIIQFELLVLNKKNIKLGFRDEINDLIKDILRNI